MAADVPPLSHIILPASVHGLLELAREVDVAAPRSSEYSNALSRFCRATEAVPSSDLAVAMARLARSVECLEFDRRLAMARLTRKEQGEVLRESAGAHCGECGMPLGSSHDSGCAVGQRGPRPVTEDQSVVPGNSELQWYPAEARMAELKPRELLKLAQELAEVVGQIERAEAHRAETEADLEAAQAQLSGLDKELNKLEARLKVLRQRLAAGA